MITDDQHQSAVMDLPGLERLTFPTGEEIYDKIMGEIEPELVTANLQKLDAPYANETEEEHASRYKRYSKAFAEYKVQYETWASELKEALTVYKRSVMKAAEGANDEQEAALLRQIEDQISTA